MFTLDLKTQFESFNHCGAACFSFSFSRTNNVVVRLSSRCRSYAIYIW